MQDGKTIFVTGATGNQGGAVVRSLLDRGFRVKALTRDPASARAQMIKDKHAELVQGDLNDPATYRDHLKGLYGLFSVQTFENGIDKEIAQGIALADLAREYRVGHFIYSSGLGTDLNTGIPHWESKLKIEEHIKQLSIPYTILRPASFFENFLIPQVKRRILQGKLASPIKKDISQPFLSSKDLGEISAEIFLNPQRHLYRTLPLASQQMDMNSVSAALSAGMGKEITYQQLPLFIARLVMGKNLYKMFKWINRGIPVPVDLQECRKEWPQMMELAQWIKLNFDHSNP